ncbi:MAG: glycan-binding surface protein [Proteiniphilum sp.]|nr:glycan-binding surface protein [Proteiniphilum sp.]
MKKIHILYLTLLTLIGITFLSCEESENLGSTPIRVTKIYLEDYESSVPDRPVEFARLGQMIRIEGSGFLGMKKVFINGYDTYFNVAYVTDNSMLISIHRNTPVVDAEEELRNTIRLVKEGTDITYTFTIMAASPTITRLSNTLPQPGDLVTAYGENLHETSKVTLPGGVEVTNIVSDEEGEWFTFTMPDGVTASGSLFSEGANGKAATPAYFNFTEGILLDWDGNGEGGAWSWSEGGSMIGIQDSDDQQSDLVSDPLNSGRGNCVPLIPERILNGANGGVVAGKARATEVWTAGTDNPMDDWSRLYAYIPETTPLNEVAFQFDIYVPDPWSNTGQIQLVLYNNFNFTGVGSDDDGQRTAFYIPYIQDGVIVPYQTEGWETVTIPFSEFGYYANMLEDDEATPPTFKNVVEDRLAATYQNFGMGIVNTDFTYQDVEVISTLFNQEIYVDNWRLVPVKTVTVSDYDDEE